MSYAGNPSLSSDVQGRILETFRHTLDVASRGEVEEARLGCDFIQRLDPLFAPAQVLADRLRGASGPVAVDDLRSRLDGDAGAAGDLALEELPELPLDPSLLTVEEMAPAESGPDLRGELAALLAARDFERLMERAHGAQAAIAADPALQRLLGEAQERMEAAPYVDRFLDKARAALAAGNADEARAAVDKARALDDSHPGVVALAAQLSAPAAARGGAQPAASWQAPAASPPAPSFGELDTAAGDELPAMPGLADGLGSRDLSAGLSGGGPGAAFGGFSDSLPGPDLSTADAGLGSDLPLDLPPLDLPDLDAMPAEPAFAGAVEPVAEPAAGGASDPDPRIAELLDEGQALFARGDHQQAIDAWSRIFLIDIDHQEAARRIDMARSAKAEQERLVEEAYHDALAKVQARSLDDARAALERVLELQPAHAGAREALDKLDRGQLDDLPKPPPAVDPLAAFGEDGADAVLQEEILVPPEPGTAAARPAAAAPAAGRGADSRRKLLIAAAAVVVVVLAAGWFLRERWAALFPNTDEAPVATQQAVDQTPIARATQLDREGNRAMAISQLKRVNPRSPFYEEAQALLAQWEAEGAAAQGAGPAPEVLAQQDALLDQARQAHAERRYLAVAPLLDQAATLAPLPAEVATLREDAATRLQPLQEPLSLLRSEEYERSLRLLWVELEKDSSNPDVRQLLTGAYYNLGVLNLQQGKPDQAIGSLSEAAALSPDDPDVQRLLQLARTYEDRAPDLLYRIYTKYLTPRKL